MPPRTIIVPGDGTATLQYVLPKIVGFEVQSVYAEIDATAGNSQPTLTVYDQAGVVIARKRQSESIDVAAPGSATWALRLADSGAPSHTWTAQFTHAGTAAFDNLVLQSEALTPGSPGVGPASFITLSGTWTFAAGAQIQVGVFHNAPGALTASLPYVDVQRLDVIARERLVGNPAPAPQFPVLPLPINTHLFGAALLDVTNPTNVKVVAAGTYALSFVVTIF